MTTPWSTSYKAHSTVSSTHKGHHCYYSITALAGLLLGEFESFTIQGLGGITFLSPVFGLILAGAAQSSLLRGATWGFAGKERRGRSEQRGTRMCVMILLETLAGKTLSPLPTQVQLVKKTHRVERCRSV